VPPQLSKQDVKGETESIGYHRYIPHRTTIIKKMEFKTHKMHVFILNTYSRFFRKVIAYLTDII
jgi:hypothetical protein